MKKGQIRRVWTSDQKAEIVSKNLSVALNGWMKEELYLDFRLASTENVPLLLDKYVHNFNNRRPAAALGYKSPVQYKTELGF